MFLGSCTLINKAGFMPFIKGKDCDSSGLKSWCAESIGLGHSAVGMSLDQNCASGQDCSVTCPLHWAWLEPARPLPLPTFWTPPLQALLALSWCNIQGTGAAAAGEAPLGCPLGGSSSLSLSPHILPLGQQWCGLRVCSWASEGLHCTHHTQQHSRRTPLSHFFIPTSTTDFNLCSFYLFPFPAAFPRIAAAGPKLVSTSPPPALSLTEFTLFRRFIFHSSLPLQLITIISSTQMQRFPQEDAW